MTRRVPVRAARPRTSRPLAAALALAAGLTPLVAPPPAAAQGNATGGSADEATDQTLELMDRLGPLLGAPQAPGADPGADAAIDPADGEAAEALAPGSAPGPLAPLPAPEARPYPYAVLDVRPGMTRDEAVATLEAAAGRDLGLAAETLRVRVAASDGRAFEFAYDVTLKTPERDPYAGLRRLHDPTDVEASEGFGLSLATDVLGGRVLGVTRSLRRLNDAPDALPQREALRAQLEGLYGPPSHVEEGTDERGRVFAVWSWAWGEDGPIADLEGQPERTMQHEAARGDIRAVRYRPCADGSRDGLSYEFEHPRPAPHSPGCVAVYRVSYSADIASTSATFRLRDYALARAQRDEIDAQIANRLLGEPAVPAEPSDMDL